MKSLTTWKWSKTIFALGRWVVTAAWYAADMSMATASILAPLGRSRFQNGFSASAPLPSPTKTTAPLSRSMTTVR